MIQGLRLFVLLSCLMSVQVYADKNIFTGWFSKKAVSGYDPVAYFTQGKPVKGKAQHQLSFKEVKWFFASEAHKKLFSDNPEKYMPQYGGYCAWAVAAKKSRAAGDPNYWKIVDDKLYLNYDASVQKTWLKDVDGFIKQADKNWPEMIK